MFICPGSYDIDPNHRLDKHWLGVSQILSQWNNEQYLICERCVRECQISLQLSRHIHLRNKAKTSPIWLSGRLLQIAIQRCAQEEGWRHSFHISYSLAHLHVRFIVALCAHECLRAFMKSYCLLPGLKQTFMRTQTQNNDKPNMKMSKRVRRMKYTSSMLFLSTAFSRNQFDAFLQLWCIYASTIRNSSLQQLLVFVFVSQKRLQCNIQTKHKENPEHM